MLAWNLPCLETPTWTTNMPRIGWSQHLKMLCWCQDCCIQFLAAYTERHQVLCFADVSNCLEGSNLQDSAGSLRTPASPHPPLWSGLTAAACLNATQHLRLRDSSSSYELTAGATSQGDVLAESRLQPEQDTMSSSLSRHGLKQSERHQAIFMLPLQLLRHMQTLQQKVDVNTWQMLWRLYATEDLSQGALQIALRSRTCL